MQVLWKELGKDEFGEWLAGSEKGGSWDMSMTSNLRSRTFVSGFTNTFGIKFQIYSQEISSKIQLIRIM
jgi:hypothetical protein